MQTRWVVWFHATNIRGLLRALRSRNSLTCSKQPLSASCMTSRQAGHLALLVCQLRRVSAHEHSWIAACARLARCVLTALLIMVFLSGDGELSTRQLSRWLCRLQCDWLTVERPHTCVPCTIHHAEPAPWSTGHEEQRGPQRGGAALGVFRRYGSIRSEEKSRPPHPIFTIRQGDFYVSSTLRKSDCAVAHARSPQLFT